MAEINMSSVHADGGGGSEEEIVEFAIRTYQRNFGIGVTGKLDDETKSRMKRARCGNSDFIDGATPINFDPKSLLQKYSAGGASAVEILRSAVGKYQEHHGIEATGNLDSATLAHMKTKIPRSDGSNAGSSLTRLQNRVYDPDRAVMLAFKAISDMAERIELEDQRCTRGRNLEPLVAACIYIACREEGNPPTVKDICSVVAGATEKEFGREIEFVVKQLNVKDGDQSMRHFYSDLGMSNEEVRAVEETAQRAGDLDIR